MGFLDLSDDILLLIIEWLPPARLAPKDGRALGNRSCSLKSTYVAKSKLLPHRFETNELAYQPTRHVFESVCRRLRSLVTTYTFKWSPNYEFDIMLMEAREIWTTWTSIPVKSTMLDTVKANIYLGGPGPPCYKAWRSVNSRPEPGVWSLMDVLNSLCLYRIAPPKRFTPLDMRSLLAMVRKSGSTAGIGVLELDFLDPTMDLSEYHCPLLYTDYLTSLKSGRDRQYAKLRADGHNCIECVAPGYAFESVEKLYNTVTASLDTILTPAYHIHTGVLFSMVGRFKFSVNGQMMHEIDLGDIIARTPDRPILRSDGWTYDYDLHFQAWRELVVTQRLLRGLSMPDMVHGKEIPYKRQYHNPNPLSTPRISVPRTPQKDLIYD